MAQPIPTTTTLPEFIGIYNARHSYPISGDIAVKILEGVEKIAVDELSKSGGTLEKQKTKWTCDPDEYTFCHLVPRLMQKIKSVLTADRTIYDAMEKIIKTRLGVGNDIVPFVFVSGIFKIDIAIVSKEQAVKMAESYRYGGDGYEVSFAKALEYYVIAAKQGDILVLQDISTLYLHNAEEVNVTDDDFKQLIKEICAEW